MVFDHTVVVWVYCGDPIVFVAGFVIRCIVVVIVVAVVAGVVVVVVVIVIVVGYCCVFVGYAVVLRVNIFFVLLSASCMHVIHVVICYIWCCCVCCCYCWLLLSFRL